MATGPSQWVLCYGMPTTADECNVSTGTAGIVQVPQYLSILQGEQLKGEIIALVFFRGAALQHHVKVLKGFPHMAGIGQVNLNLKVAGVVAAGIYGKQGIVIAVHCA